MALPLAQQGVVILYTNNSLSDIDLANAWIGYGLCYIILSAIYYSNAWNVSRRIIIHCTDG